MTPADSDHHADKTQKQLACQIITYYYKAILVKV